MGSEGAGAGAGALAPAADSAAATAVAVFSSASLAAASFFLTFLSLFDAFFFSASARGHFECQCISFG